MARTTSSVSASKQLRATTAAKAARLEEAGLGGGRTGEASASTRRAQARRDVTRSRPAAVAVAPTSVPAPSAQSSAARKAIKGAKARAARAAPRKKDAGAVMTVLVNGSRSVGEGGPRFNAHVREVIARALSRFKKRLTRVEVHFSDESGPTKSIGNDKRCRIEARPAAVKAVSAGADAPTAEHALAAAAGKMQRLLATRLVDRKRPRPPRR